MVQFQSTLLKWIWIFPTAPTMSAVGKEPHLSSFSFFSRGPLLDCFGQIMLYSRWSTQTWYSTHACVPATNKAVLWTLMMEQAVGPCTYCKHRRVVAVGNPNCMWSESQPFQTILWWIEFSVGVSVLVTLTWSWSSCCWILVSIAGEASTWTPQLL